MVRHTAIRVCCARTYLGLDQLLALHEGTAGLHQVIHNDHVPALGRALLEPHDALVPIAHLGANDLTMY